MMTHKDKLVPFIDNLTTSDPFAVVKKEETQYFCCFGCKKHYKDRLKIRAHMKGHPECMTKHEEFLKTIGATRKTECSEDDTYYKQKYLEYKRENEILKQRVEGLEDNSVFATRINSLEKDLYLSNTQVQRLEEYYRILPLFMRPDCREYCEKFVKAIKDNEKAIIDGYTRQTQRKELIGLLHNTPLLQMYFLPQHQFLLNHHFQNGEYQTLTGNYFTNFDYHPSVQPRGNVEHVPSLPRLKLSLSEDDLKKMDHQDQQPPIKQKRPAKQA